MYRDVLQRLDDKRLEAGITFIELAKMTGLSTDTCRNYLAKNNERYNYASIKRIADILDPEMDIPLDFVECGICKKVFARPNSRVHYCSPECKKIAHDNIQKNYDRSKYYKPKEDKINNSKKLSEIAKMAADMGMSYGKYVSLKEVQCNL